MKTSASSWRRAIPLSSPTSLPISPKKSTTKFQLDLMKELIRRTLFATDTESSRYALGGVLLEMDEEKIIAVGTDGRRLAKMEGPAVSVGGHVTGDAMTIVPIAIDAVGRTRSIRCRC